MDSGHLDAPFAAVFARGCSVPTRDPPPDREARVECEFPPGEHAASEKGTPQIPDPACI